MSYNGSQAQSGRGTSLSIGPQAPTGLAVAPSSTGGTLAAGSYFWKVSAIVSSVESLASNEVTATTSGSTSSAVLTWAAVPGAASYRIYRGTTAGGESAYQTSVTNSFTDTGTVGTAGTPLTSSGTLIGELSDFPLERGKWDTADVTNFQSGADSEFISVIRKPGSLTLKGNRVSSDTGQQAVETAYQNGTLQSFSAALPKTASQTTKGDSYTFNALVLNYSFTIQPTKQIEFSIELQISGAVAATIGS